MHGAERDGIDEGWRDMGMEMEHVRRDKGWRVRLRVTVQIQPMSSSFDRGAQVDRWCPEHGHHLSHQIPS